VADYKDTTGLDLVAEYPPLLEYAKRLTRDGPEAADLVQAAMVRALWNEGSVPQNLGAWLRTVLFRLFVDERRRRRSTKECSFDVSVLDKVEEIEEPPASWSSVSVEDVRRALPLLPRNFREPFDLFAFHQLSYRDIATRLSLSIKTVGTRIARARSKLRLLLRAAYTTERDLPARDRDAAAAFEGELPAQDAPASLGL
jgi:RNA polymerase sigma-70 factor (ECF subfamily)